MLPCRKGWLLERVLESDSLREKFVFRDRSNKVVWNKLAVRDYYQRVGAFLEVLLILVYITSGQPARGTEIIGLLHSNTTLHWNIFAEDGLISLVTSYHKGYTCTGSTRIIHRYLPKEVSELYVYYLWVILRSSRSLDFWPLTRSALIHHTCGQKVKGAGARNDYRRS